MTTVSKPKRGFLFWLKRIVTGFLIFILALIATVFAGGALVRAQVKANYPPPGEMVDVGGYRLHIHCEGEGSPTVVILAGSGVPSTYYWLIQSEAAKATRVCVYDRAGYAWSEEGSGDLSPMGQVEDLEILLANAGIEAPYILAGHSYGGYIARLYTQAHPEAVAGTGDDRLGARRPVDKLSAVHSGHGAADVFRSQQAVQSLSDGVPAFAADHPPCQRPDGGILPVRCGRDAHRRAETASAHYLHRQSGGQ
jgi:pimeloyl-ACP methyl ester carboxylesterase